MFIFLLLTEALTKAIFCTFRPKYLPFVLYFITVTVGVFLFALSLELYILVYFYRRIPSGSCSQLVWLVTTLVFLHWIYIYILVFLHCIYIFIYIYIQI